MDGWRDDWVDGPFLIFRVVEVKYTLDIKTSEILARCLCSTFYPGTWPV